MFPPIPFLFLFYSVILSIPVLSSSAHSALLLLTICSPPNHLPPFNHHANNQENLQSDKTYKAVDAMKKKAIHTSANYEEFKNFVDCASQVPVTSKEMLELGQKNSAWTIRKTRHQIHKERSKKLSKSNGTRGGKKGSDSGPGSSSQSFPTQPPKSSMEFSRDWKRHCKGLSEKSDYLKLCGLSACKDLWKVEIEVDVLSALIEVFSQRAALSWSGSDLLEWLLMVPTCGRFSLTCAFLEQKYNDMLSNLLDDIAKNEIEGDARRQDDVKRVKDAFKL